MKSSFLYWHFHIKTSLRQIKSPFYYLISLKNFILPKLNPFLILNFLFVNCLPLTSLYVFPLLKSYTSSSLFLPVVHRCHIVAVPCCPCHHTAILNLLRSQSNNVIHNHDLLFYVRFIFLGNGIIRPAAWMLTLFSSGIWAMPSTWCSLLCLPLSIRQEYAPYSW